MRVRNILIVALLTMLMVASLTSCQKNEQEASPVPRADDGFRRSFKEMTSFTLSNGATVYLQEDTTRDEVAVELFYRAGFCDEPAGKAQISHLSEHVVAFSPTASYAAKEIVPTVRSFGRINAEAVGDFVKYDFIAPRAHLEELFKIANEQLTSIRFDEGVREEQAKRAAEEITSVLNTERSSLKRFGMITLLQAIQHGEKFVPIEKNNYDLTIEDLAAFHKQRYRTNDMVIAIVGNIDPDSTRALVEKYFGGIPASAEPPRYTVKLPANMSVRWDIAASVGYVVYPGPFDDERDRAALVAFGAYLSQVIARDPEVLVMATTTYTTNPAYPLNRLPFFVFVQPELYRSTAEVCEKVISLIDGTIADLDESTFTRIMSTMQNQMERSALESAARDDKQENHVVLGQRALDLGMRHYLRDGRSAEDYSAMLGSLTFEEMKQILQKYLSGDQRRIVTISNG